MEELIDSRSKENVFPPMCIVMFRLQVEVSLRQTLPPLPSFQTFLNVLGHYFSLRQDFWRTVFFEKFRESATKVTHHSLIAC